jgi:hypothetical protein
MDISIRACSISYMVDGQDRHLVCTPHRLQQVKMPQRARARAIGIHQSTTFRSKRATNLFIHQLASVRTVRLVQYLVLSSPECGAQMRASPSFRVSQLPASQHQAPGTSQRHHLHCPRVREGRLFKVRKFDLRWKASIFWHRKFDRCPGKSFRVRLGTD